MMMTTTSTSAKASFLSVAKIAHLFPFNHEMGFRLPLTCLQCTRVNLQQLYSWSERWSQMLLLPSNSSKRPLKFQQTKGNFRHQPSLFSSSALMTDSPTPSKHFRASGSPRAKTTAKLHRKYCSCGGFHQVNKAFITPYFNGPFSSSSGDRATNRAEENMGDGGISCNLKWKKIKYASEIANRYSFSI